MTGASGGAGGLAVQLAAIAGAYVGGVAPSEEGARWVAGPGADEVVASVDRVAEPVDVVVDTVGGDQLVSAYALLASGGSLQSVGWAAGREAVLPVGSTLGNIAPTSIMSVYNGGGLTDRQAQLTRMLTLVAAGRLKVPVGWRGPWDKVADAVEALGSRTLRGKAVLDAG
ncbi:zinc-binding dehydrogenase [Streptomyces sp. NPDC005202]|uniref:zinc-binding dehydrogenase n=1 Tax=Streptomyces sp. NPDC005202 TaxID=3157021 RepID=UPI0033BD46E3